MPDPSTPTPLTDADLGELQARLDALPAPLEPLDVMALDGYLCGVILQPRPIAPADWQRHVLDVDGRAPPAGTDAGPLLALVQRRHAELRHAIDHRDWFDPWIFELDGEATPTETVLPWVAGFATALDLFPALSEVRDPALLEPLALIYMHFDPEDLEDADTLLELIDALEPAPDLAEAVQDIVRAIMLLADVTRPRTQPPSRPARRPPPRRAGPATRARPVKRR